MMFKQNSLNETVSLGAQSASSVTDTGEKNGSVLVLPIGSVEQHGEHLPVMTDTLLANSVATKSAKRVVNEYLWRLLLLSGLDTRHTTFLSVELLLESSVRYLISYVMSQRVDSRTGSMRWCSSTAMVAIPL
jgi:creatinine amidohydrolase/Fe(II)-dependent formamide hydrolase-like protein